MEHNIETEWADVFECSCGYKYEGPNRSAVEDAHLYVNHFIDDDEDKSESEKFFAHLNNGEVQVEATGWVEDSNSGPSKKLWPHRFRVVITPKEG